MAGYICDASKAVIQNELKVLEVAGHDSREWYQPQLKVLARTNHEFVVLRNAGPRGFASVIDADCPSAFLTLHLSRWSTESTNLL